MLPRPTRIAGWAGAGAACTAAVLILPPVGLLAVIAVGLAIHRLGTSKRREAWGVFFGAAAVCLIIAVATPDEPPCRTLLLTTAQSSETCSDFAPLPWFLAATAFAVTAVGGMFLPRHRRER